MGTPRPGTAAYAAKLARNMRYKKAARSKAFRAKAQVRETVASSVRKVRAQHKAQVQVLQAEVDDLRARSNRHFLLAQKGEKASKDLVKTKKLLDDARHFCESAAPVQGRLSWRPGTSPPKYRQIMSFRLRRVLENIETFLISMFSGFRRNLKIISFQCAVPICFWNVRDFLDNLPCAGAAFYQRQLLKKNAAESHAKLKQQEKASQEREAAMAAENEALKKELKEQDLQWGWVLAKVSAKEGRRLRLMASAPPRNRDRCWGGGQ